jgi:hypothetical protein
MARTRNWLLGSLVHTRARCGADVSAGLAACYCRHAMLGLYVTCLHGVARLYRRRTMTWAREDARCMVCLGRNPSHAPHRTRYYEECAGQPVAKRHAGHDGKHLQADESRSRMRAFCF